MQDFLTVLIYACAAVAAVAFFIAVFTAFEAIERSASLPPAKFESALIAAIPALVIGGTVASMASAGVA